MRYGLCSALLIAMLACDSALLRGQSNPLTPSLRTERANTVLGARIQWLEDTLPIDPCSILRATGDTGFVSRLDAEVRSRLLHRQVATPCTPLGGGSPVAHVELASVTGTRDAAVITLLVHGRGIGSLLQRHRFDATNGWRIEIEFPVPQHDRAPRPAPPDTLRNDRAGLPFESLTVAARSDAPCAGCVDAGNSALLAALRKRHVGDVEPPPSSGHRPGAAPASARTVDRARHRVGWRNRAPLNHRSPCATTTATNTCSQS